RAAARTGHPGHLRRPRRAPGARAAGVDKNRRHRRRVPQPRLPRTHRPPRRTLRQHAVLRPHDARRDRSRHRARRRGRPPRRRHDAARISHAPFRIVPHPRADHLAAPAAGAAGLSLFVLDHTLCGDPARSVHAAVRPRRIAGFRLPRLSDDDSRLLQFPIFVRTLRARRLCSAGIALGRCAGGRPAAVRQPLRRSLAGRRLAGILRSDGAARAVRAQELPGPAGGAFGVNRVLVTGGAGSIGSNLAALLVERGHDVTVLDDLSSGHRDLVPPSVRFVHGSIEDEGALAQAFDARPQWVFHLAALFANQNSVDHPQRDLAVNGGGTVKVLQQAVLSNAAKLLFTSSSCVYGHKEVMREDDQAYDLDTPYAISKLLGEHYCRYWSRQFGIDTVVVRLFNTYGPHEYPGRYRNVIPNFFALAMRGEP